MHQWKVAIPLHPEFGTEPNVFYVPPMSPAKLDSEGQPTTEMRIPVAYLQSLFGENVHAALATLLEQRERRKQGHASELMDLLIAYDWTQNFDLDTDKRTVV